MLEYQIVRLLEKYKQHKFPIPYDAAILLAQSLYVTDKDNLLSQAHKILSDDYNSRITLEPKINTNIKPKDIYPPELMSVLQTRQSPEHSEGLQIYDTTTSQIYIPNIPSSPKLSLHSPKIEPQIYIPRISSPINSKNNTEFRQKYNTLKDDQVMDISNINSTTLAGYKIYPRELVKNSKQLYWIPGLKLVSNDYNKLLQYAQIINLHGPLAIN